MHFKLRYKMYTTHVGLNSFRNYWTGCSIILPKIPDDLRCITIVRNNGMKQRNVRELTFFFSLFWSLQIKRC